MIDVRRRRISMGAIACVLSVAAGGRGLLDPTPGETPGPFYPRQLPLDDDSDLTQVVGRAGRASGKIGDLDGRLLNINGEPVPYTRIEIWQCDANGRYHHPWDRGLDAADPRFQGHGHSVTDRDGRYRFRTIRPVPYPGRTPHIHFAVVPRGLRPFTTQLYIAGEPLNNRDPLYRRIPVTARRLVIAEFLPAETEGTDFRVTYDIVLATPARGTVRNQF